MTNALVAIKIASVFDARIAREVAAKNDSAAHKLTALKVDFVSLADVFADSECDAMLLDVIAIYAAQKVVKMLETIKSKRDCLDHYTRNILRNAAQYDFSLSNHECNLSCSKFIDAANARAMTHRAASNMNTATTQASSSRQALAFMRAATLQKHSVTIDVKNANARALYDVLNVKLTDDSEALDDTAHVNVAASMF